MSALVTLCFGGVGETTSGFHGTAGKVMLVNIGGCGICTLCSSASEIVTSSLIFTGPSVVVGLYNAAISSSC